MNNASYAKIFEATAEMSAEADKLSEFLSTYTSFHNEMIKTPKRHSDLLNVDFVSKDRTGNHIIIEFKSGLNISQELLEPLLEVLNILKDGKTVTLFPKGKVLTTQEVADLLGCSRQHVVNLCNTGELEFEEIGTHKKVSVANLEKYRAKRSEQKRDAMGSLMSGSQDFMNEYGDDLDMD